MREFEVLEKVKHENIVKLLAIEEEQEGRGKVETSQKPKNSFIKKTVHFAGDSDGAVHWRITVQPLGRPREQLWAGRGRVSVGGVPPLGWHEPPQG